MFEALARGDRRALLTLATGTGKTFIATNMLRRIADAGQLRRALFLCDRDELRRQGLAAMATQFGADAAEVRRVGGRNNAQNARVHVATYQTLGVDEEDGEASFLDEFYPEPDHFSHIVIDECHRSAWGKWHAVLARNPNAVQIGLTATPRSLKIKEDSDEARADARIRADNLRHFGEPRYEYDIAQGIEDGYLAACEIVRCDVHLEGRAEAEGATGFDPDADRHTIRSARTGVTDGAEEPKAHYEATSFEAAIEIPERVTAMCRDLFDRLIHADPAAGPEQKTIVFCARDAHAERVAAELNNLYADWAAATGARRAEPFAFRCTAASGGSAELPDLKGAERSHFVATTVDLLTTGVDVPWLRNVVFFRYMRSPISFYQMIGRGTRIHEPSGKYMFRVYDYTDATRLLGEEFASAAGGGTARPRAEAPDEAPDALVVEGVTVELREAGHFVLMRRDGRDERVPIEEYRALLAAELRTEAPDLGAFQAIWIEPRARRAMMDRVTGKGFSPRVLQMTARMEGYDAFDVLAQAAYEADPRTRTGRAARARGEAWVTALPPGPRAAVEALAAQFEAGGTEELESRGVLTAPAVARAGGLAALARIGEPREVLRRVRVGIFG